MTTYYVRKPPNGNDGNDGLSKDTAWATLGKAVATMGNGDTLIIGAGNYDEDYTNASNSLTIIGDYDGSLTGDVGWVKMYYFHLAGEDITVKWLWTVGYGGASNHVGTALEVGNDQLLEHIVVAFEMSTVVYGDTGGVGGATLDTCLFNGLVIVRSGHIYVKSCTFTRDTCIPTGACYFGESAGWDFTITIKNCIFSTIDNTANHAMIGFGVVNPDTSTIDIDFNDYYVPNGCAIVYTSTGNYHHTIEQWQNDPDHDWSGTNLNSIEVNPLFKNDGFHIKEDSPCVDVGTVYGLSRDIDNEGRPHGDAYDMGCDEYYFAPPDTSEDTFTFEVSPRARIGPVLIRETPYREPQLKWPCTHNLPSGQYTLYTCPRCLGKGYFYDIKFDAGGLIPQVWDETKLAQELEKITITDFNPFHPEYGAKLKSRVGQVSKDDLKAIIKSDLLNAVYNLIKYQKAEANKGTEDGYFSPRELIDRVEKVEIVELSVTALHFAIYILTVSGKEIEITGEILV